MCIKHVTHRSLLLPPLGSWVHTVVLWSWLYLLTVAGRRNTAAPFCFMVTWPADVMCISSGNERDIRLSQQTSWEDGRGVAHCCLIASGVPFHCPVCVIVYPSHPFFPLFLCPDCSVSVLRVWPYVCIWVFTFGIHDFHSCSGSINILIINGWDYKPCVCLGNTFLKVYLRGLRWV